MQQIIMVLHVLVAIAIIALVLMQHGKGADIGATFGSGASNTMFGSQGSMPFLMKITVILATIFFLTSLSLGYMVAKQSHPRGNQKISLPAKSNNAPAVSLPLTEKPKPAKSE